VEDGACLGLVKAHNIAAEEVFRHTLVGQWLALLADTLLASAKGTEVICGFGDHWIFPGLVARSIGWSGVLIVPSSN
jgi:hypothetical protein